MAIQITRDTQIGGRGESTLRVFFLFFSKSILFKCFLEVKGFKRYFLVIYFIILSTFGLNNQWLTEICHMRWTEKCQKGALHYLKSSSRLALFDKWKLKYWWNWPKVGSWTQFHQLSTHSFCAGRLTPVKYKSKT